MKTLWAILANTYPPMSPEEWRSFKWMFYPMICVVSAMIFSVIFPRKY